MSFVPLLQLYRDLSNNVDLDIYRHLFSTGPSILKRPDEFRLNSYLEGEHKPEVKILRQTVFSLSRIQCLLVPYRGLSLGSFSGSRAKRSTPVGWKLLRTSIVGLQRPPGDTVYWTRDARGPVIRSGSVPKILDINKFKDSHGSLPLT